MTDQKLTHIDEKGEVPHGGRLAEGGYRSVAVAEGFIAMHPETLDMIAGGTAQKGDVLACARVAGVMAASSTRAIFIPYVPPAQHHEGQGGVHAGVHQASVERARRLACSAPPAASRAKTGIEMEARSPPRAGCASPCTTCARPSIASEIVDVRMSQEGRR